MDVETQFLLDTSEDVFDLVMDIPVFIRDYISKETLLTALGDELDLNRQTIDAAFTHAFCENGE